MNYFAHGREFVARPYFLAGTAVPDWLGVADRRVRVRSKQAAPLVEHADPRLAAIAAGIVRHHHDDDWFHRTRAFVETCLSLSGLIRAALPTEDTSLRASFLGHILLELLLDAELIAERPARLDEYYAALGEVDPQLVQAVVNLAAPQPTERLAGFISIFCRERFLCDYSSDGKLLGRLNQVLSRVGLPPLHACFCDLLPEARRRVAARKPELVSPGEDG